MATRRTDLRGSGQSPAGNDSPRPEATAFPSASAGTDPGAAGCPRTLSSERPPLRSGTHPAQEGGGESVSIHGNSTACGHVKA